MTYENRNVWKVECKKTREICRYKKKSTNTRLCAKRKVIVARGWGDRVKRKKCEIRHISKRHRSLLKVALTAVKSWFFRANYTWTYARTVPRVIGTVPRFMSLRCRRIYGDRLRFPASGRTAQRVVLWKCGPSYCNNMSRNTLVGTLALDVYSVYVFDKRE